MKLAGVLDVFIDTGITIHMKAPGVLSEEPFRKILSGEKLELKGLKTELKAVF